MAKITRKDQQVFASTAGDEAIAKFGSLAAGSPGFSTDPDEIQTDEFKGGWESAVIGQASPAMEDRNALDYLYSRQLGYLYQQGIPEYSATTTFYKGSVVSYFDADEETLKLYYSLVDDNTGNSLEDDTKWAEFKSGGGGASLPLLTFQFTDHLLNDMSFLRANGSWNSGDVYVAAFRHLTNDLGFRYESSTLTVSHYNYDAGTYVRISALDTTIDTTTYYCWGISGTTDPTKCIFTITTTLADGVKVFAYKDATTIYQLTAGIVAPKTEVVGSTTITFYKAQDGHKIALGDQASNALAIYQEMGISWYFIYDDTNTRFKLPRSNWNFKATSDNNTGDFVNQSLPNITGESTGQFVKATAGSPIGAFKEGDAVASKAASGTAYGAIKIGIDASGSSSVYQNNANVQEKATRAFLYFYVGTFEQAAIEQTAGLAQEDFQNKADTDLGNLDSDGKAQIGQLVSPSGSTQSVLNDGQIHDSPGTGILYFGATAAAGVSATNIAYVRIYVYNSEGTFIYGERNDSCVATSGMSCHCYIGKGLKYKYESLRVTGESVRFMPFNGN